MPIHDSQCNVPVKTLTLDAYYDCTFEYRDQPPPGASDCCGHTYCGTCRKCDVCGMTIEGSAYHCRDSNLDAHQRCAMLPKTIPIDDDAVFVLRSGVLAKCNWCKQKKLKGSVKNVPGFTYVSQYKKLSFHVYCLMEMGIEHLAGVGREVGNPDRRVQRYVRGGASKVVKVVKLFLKFVLSVLFGDPTAILASIVVELLAS